MSLSRISYQADTTGYIEFEGNNGDIYRFSVSAGGYVQFGAISGSREQGKSS